MGVSEDRIVKIAVIGTGYVGLVSGAAFLNLALM